MAESGFLARKPKSPTGLVLVIALHGAALTALATSKMEVVAPDYGSFTGYNVPITDPPPPEPAPEPQPQKARKSVIDIVKPHVPTPPTSDSIVMDLTDIPPFPADYALGIDPPVPPKPPAPPVRVEARIDPSSDLQPPYPPSEQRMDREGSVTIRVVIGTDGRLKSAEKVRATNDAFYRSTERHALAHWRFEPATIDGRPVESRRTMTVHFRLNG